MSTSTIETGYVILARPGADTSTIDRAIKVKVNNPQNIDAFIPEFRDVRTMWTTGGGLNLSQVKEISNLAGVEGIFPNKPVSMKTVPILPGFVTSMPSTSQSNALVQCTTMSLISNQVQPSKISQGAMGTMQKRVAEETAVEIEFRPIHMKLRVISQPEDHPDIDEFDYMYRTKAGEETVPECMLWIMELGKHMLYILTLR